MPGCCDPSGYADVFGDRFARGLARRYRRRGLDRTARRIVDLLAEHGIEGATVLEIGGGVGDIQLELLRRGADRATNLELVDTYDDVAAALAREAGLSERMERRRVDLAAEPDAVEPTDVVVLHRVVCCYPDYERLLSAAAGRTRRVLVFSHPPRNLASRALLGAQNGWFRLSGNSFRTFAHPPRAMLAVLESAGLHTSYHHRGAVWQVRALERPAAGGALRGV